MKNIITTIFTTVLLAGLMGLTACKKLSSYDYPAGAGTAYDIIKDDASYSNFKIAVDRSGLAGLFKDADAHTFFIPTNNALIASGYSVVYLQGLAQQDAAALVKNHIVAGKVDVKTTTTPLTALSGKQIAIQAANGSYFADGNDVTNANISISNGYLNVINNVITWHENLLDAVNKYMHSTANSQLTFLAAALTRASTGSTNFNSLLTGTTPYTLFAPTNAAFIDGGLASVAAVNAAPVETLVNILKYHLVAGAKLTTSFDSVPVAAYNGTNIYFDRFLNFRTTQFYANGIMFGNGGSNIIAKNGIMNIVPRLLTAPIATTTLARIQSDANLSVFQAAIVKASTADPAFDFQAMLSGTRSYTIFAVTNAGMAAAGYPDVAAVNAATPEALAKIIKFHILRSRLNNITMVDNSTATTLLTVPNANGTQGSTSLTFTLTGGYKVKGPTNTASVTVSPANITTTNGILNVVGTVLTP